MKNRLQFRHCPRIFNNKEEIKAHLVGLFNNDNSPLKPAMAAEPLVLYYKESGETDVNAVLALGRPTSNDEYFLIDVAGIQKDIEVLADEVFNISDVSERLDQEIEDRISGDTKLGNILKRICESAGFNNDGEDMGAYDDIAHDATHYIVSALSLANADVLLDEAIWQNHVDIVHKAAELREDLKVSLERNVSARTLVSYDLLQGGELVGKIEIPSDRNISSGELIRNDNGEYILRFYVANENDTIIDSFDVNVENLEDIYVGGPGVSIEGNVISIDVPGFIGNLNSVVSGESNGFKVVVAQLEGRLSGVTVEAPAMDNILSAANAYTDSVAADVLEQAKEYTDENVTSIYKVKGSKTYFEELAEIEDPQVGDVWNVENEYRYTGNTGEIKIYPAGSNFVYVKDEYAAVGRWDPLGGQTYDMDLYLTKEEFMSYSSASTGALNAKIDALSAGTVQEIQTLNDKVDSITYTSDDYLVINNSARTIEHTRVIASLDELDSVESAGTCFIDAYVVKIMKEQLEELIRESVNENKVKSIVANMIKGTDKEIAVVMKDMNGDVTENTMSADTITISFADDAYFEASLPGETDNNMEP